MLVSFNLPISSCVFGDNISKVTVPCSRLAGVQRLHQAVMCNFNDGFPLCIHLTHLMNEEGR